MKVIIVAIYTEIKNNKYLLQLLRKITNQNRKIKYEKAESQEPA